MMWITGQINGVQFLMSASLKGGSIAPPTDGWSYFNQTSLLDVEMKTKIFFREAIGQYKHLQKDGIGLWEN